MILNLQFDVRYIQRY